MSLRIAKAVATKLAQAKEPWGWRKPKPEPTPEQTEAIEHVHFFADLCFNFGVPEDQFTRVMTRFGVPPSSRAVEDSLIELPAARLEELARALEQLMKRHTGG